MRNQYGAELRGLITSAFAVDVVIEMHNADAFHDEVDAYPAINLQADIGRVADHEIRLDGHRIER
jgi:hypothetical protein